MAPAGWWSNLPNNQVGVDIQQQGSPRRWSSCGRRLPGNLRRKLDVTDFGTPVQLITTTQVGDRVRMVVDPRATGSTGLPERQPVRAGSAAAKGRPEQAHAGPGLPGDKLSLNFQNIEVRALLQVIADFTNFNVVTSDTVTAT